MRSPAFGLSTKTKPMYVDVMSGMVTADLYCSGSRSNELDLDGAERLGAARIHN